MAPVAPVRYAAKAASQPTPKHSTKPQLCLLRHLKRIIDINAAIAHRPLNLRVPQLEAKPERTKEILQPMPVEAFISEPAPLPPGPKKPNSEAIYQFRAHQFKAGDAIRAEQYFNSRSRFQQVDSREHIRIAAA